MNNYNAQNTRIYLGDVIVFEDFDGNYIRMKVKGQTSTDLIGVDDEGFDLEVPYEAIAAVVKHEKRGK